MAARGRGRKSRQHDEDIAVPRAPAVQHPWLVFPATIPEQLRADYITRLTQYLPKEIDAPHSLDWDVADTNGLTAQIASFLQQEYRGPDGSIIFTCHAWDRLFRIREPVYRELMIEFFSTVRFNAASTDITDSRVLSFHLGGVSRNCSMMEFGRRLGLYTHVETTSPSFQKFLTECLRGPPDKFVVADFWGTIANGVYESRRAIESSIRSPVHRLLHRLISTSISHRRGSEKVTAVDLFYLYCLLTPGTLFNVPYHVAFFLARRATGPKQASPMCGGQFVTRLAKSWGLLTDSDEARLLRLEPRAMGVGYLEAMRVIERTCEGGYRVVDADDHEVGDEREEVEPPARQARRKRRAPDHVEEEHQPPVTLQQISGSLHQLTESVQKLSARVEGLGLYQDEMRSYHLALASQVQLIGSMMTTLLTQQGGTPPPFPPAPQPCMDWRMLFPAPDTVSDMQRLSEYGGRDSNEEDR